MRLNTKIWYIRFEPNLIDEKNLILYNKFTENLYLLPEIYYIYIKNIKNVDSCYQTIQRKYQVDYTQAKDLVRKLKNNLLDLGVIHD